LQTGSPDEIAFNQGWISEAELEERIRLFAKNDYGNYLEGLLAQPNRGRF
jgi:glucose-1-phosphate thymidylyltransferase